MAITEPIGNFLVSIDTSKALHYCKNNVTQPNKSIFCILESKPCVCLNQWNDTNFDPLCGVYQEGCTDCTGLGTAWCHTTEFECDGVERNTDGTSQGWFYCGDEAIGHSTGVFFENTNLRILFGHRT